jgi:delta14-sterol reductase
MSALALPTAVSLSQLALALLGYSGFFLALLVAARALPGRRVQGFAQPDGQRKHYLLNGMSLFVLTHMLVIAATLVLGASLAPLVTTWFWPLFAAANVFAIGWSLVLYLRGRARGAEPSGRGFVHDFCMGVELNPTWRGVDLKHFAYQPSLIGLGLMVAAFGHAQYAELGHITPQMIALPGRLVAVPVHALPRRGRRAVDVGHHRREVRPHAGVGRPRAGALLLLHRRLVPARADPEPMSTPTLALIAAAFSLGLWIFRGANKQKHSFKLDPSAKIWGSPAAAARRRLLVSGWWGVGRKINYTGELTVYFAIAAPPASATSARSWSRCGCSRCSCTAPGATSSAAAPSTASCGRSTAASCRSAWCPSRASRAFVASSAAAERLTPAATGRRTSRSPSLSTDRGPGPRADTS